MDHFDLDKYWSWGFTADRASDRYIFDKYDVSNVYQNQGQFNDLSQQLISQLYTTRQDRTSYVSISALSFQGLVPTDNNRSYPLVAPLVEAHYEPGGDILGGRLQLSASGVLLNRTQSAIDPTQPGVDSRRATGEFNWLRSFTLSDGLRLEPFIDVREDLYGVSDLSTTDTGVKTYNQATVSNLGLEPALAAYPPRRRNNGHS